MERTELAQPQGTRCLGCANPARGRPRIPAEPDGLPLTTLFRGGKDLHHGELRLRASAPEAYLVPNLYVPSYRLDSPAREHVVSLARRLRPRGPLGPCDLSDFLSPRGDRSLFSPCRVLFAQHRPDARRLGSSSGAHGWLSRAVSEAEDRNDVVHAVLSN